MQAETTNRTTKTQVRIRYDLSFHPIKRLGQPFGCQLETSVFPCQTLGGPDEANNITNELLSRLAAASRAYQAKTSEQQERNRSRFRNRGYVEGIQYTRYRGRTAAGASGYVNILRDSKSAKWANGRVIVRGWSRWLIHGEFRVEQRASAGWLPRAPWYGVPVKSRNLLP